MKVLVPWGPGPKGEIRVYLYSTRMVEQNVTKFYVKHPLGKGRR